jgi:hypothetical protein
MQLFSQATAPEQPSMHDKTESAFSSAGVLGPAVYVQRKMSGERRREKNEKYVNVFIIVKL